MSDSSNFDMPDRQDGGDRPRDVLDDIDAAVARITEADIEARLGETLRHAGYSAHADPDLTSMLTCPGTEDIPRLLRADVDDAWRQHLRVLDMIRSASEQAERIMTEARQEVSRARDETDRALSLAAKMARDARAQSDTIVGEARREAEAILGEARREAEAILGEARREAARDAVEGHGILARPAESRIAAAERARDAIIIFGPRLRHVPRVPAWHAAVVDRVLCLFTGATWHGEDGRPEVTRKSLGAVVTTSCDDHHGWLRPEVMCELVSALVSTPCDDHHGRLLPDVFLDDSDHTAMAHQARCPLPRQCSPSDVDAERRQESWPFPAAPGCRRQPWDILWAMVPGDLIDERVALAAPANEPREITAGSRM